MKSHVIVYQHYYTITLRYLLRRTVKMPMLIVFFFAELQNFLLLQPGKSCATSSC